MYNEYQHITPTEFLLTESNGNEQIAVHCSCLAEMQQKKHDQFLCSLHLIKTMSTFMLNSKQN
jgi:hypothetical protein